MWFSGEIKNLKREESLWSACQIASMLLPCYSISPFPQCLLEQTCSSSATLCSWMPRLPLASAAPTGAAATGSPVESNRHCLGLSHGHTGQQEPQPSHCHCPMPGPARAGALATAQLRARVGSAPKASTHQGRLDNSTGTAATDRAAKPCMLAAPHLHSLFSFIVCFPLTQVHTGWFPWSQGEAQGFFFSSVVSPTATRGIGLNKYWQRNTRNKNIYHFCFPQHSNFASGHEVPVSVNLPISRQNKQD